MTGRAKSLDTSLEASVIAEVSAIVSRITGVQLGARQQVMVETRLLRRYAELGVADAREYRKYLRANLAKETEALVSLLTTHHTFFFREFQHFEYLMQTALPPLVAAAKARGDRKLRFWSAACSRGQEVYSLAMALSEALPRLDPTMDFEVLGTDVDRESVAHARNGVYHVRELKQVPASFLEGRWSRGTGDIEDYVRARESLRSRVRFQTANLLDPVALRAFGMFDVIMCRNVFIYFTLEQIKTITEGFMATLRPESFMIIGISETLTGLGLGVRSVGPSIYQLAPVASLTSVSSLAPVVAPAAEPGVKRVLCVDDSPSVLGILKLVFQERYGYKIVGTAANGHEAAEKVRELKPDLVTLDIHMPGMTGLEYLRQHHTRSHPPVVVISSVAREDASLALECLAAGAADYVEKPTLATLAERGDEIRMKLACALVRKVDAATLLRPDGAGARGAARTGAPPVALRPGVRRIVVAGLGDLASLKILLRELSPSEAPVTILTEGLGQATAALARELGDIRVGDLARDWHTTTSSCAPTDLSIMLFGSPSPAAAKLFASVRGAQILVEDLGIAHASQPTWVTDVCPPTSYSYLSRVFLGRPS